MAPFELERVSPTEYRAEAPGLGLAVSGATLMAAHEAATGALREWLRERDAGAVRRLAEVKTPVTLNTIFVWAAGGV